MTFQNDTFEEREPFFTVLTDPKFLRSRLTDETRREFFAGGEALVDFIWRTIQLRLAPDFAPTAILEYGCGAGRLVLPLAQRAARRAGSVTAVDRSPAMLGVARAEADQRSLTNIRFGSSAEFLSHGELFDLVVCYLVLQRLPRNQGMRLVRTLLRSVVAGGVAVIQFPYHTNVSKLVSGARWTREHVPGANTVANIVRGHPLGQPFIPTHVYVVEDMLRLFDAEGFPATYLTFDDHLDVSSVMVFSESPIDPAARRKHRRRHASNVYTPRESSRESTEPIDVQRLIAATSIEALNASAEQYFAALSNWDHHLAKPFSSVDEAPWLLTHLAVVLQALQLKPGMTVLEFGAGTGWLSRFLTQLGCRAVLLDVSPTALEIARALYERVPVIGDRPPPQFLPFDGHRIDLPDASVERVVSFHAFHHVPDQGAAIAEIGRVLKPGGMAVFAEPGPTHSRAPQSQFEMRTYGVVENDVDVHHVWRIAQGCGFDDLKVIVFHGLPFHVSLERFEDFLRGGETCADWVAEARVFLRNVRNFILVRAGSERDDSRSAGGLAAEIHARRADAPFAFVATVTNVGRATWLAPDVPHGGVSLGVHVWNEPGELVLTRVLSRPLTDPPREILPGETVTVEFSVPTQPPGRSIVEVDCVAAGVSWFAQLGSRPAHLSVEF